MTWLIVLIVIVIAVYIIARIGGEDSGGATDAALSAGIATGGCILQIFMYGLSLVVLIWLFGLLFG
jgi:hypothetical protein